MRHHNRARLIEIANNSLDPTKDYVLNEKGQLSLNDQNKVEDKDENFQENLNFAFQAKTSENQEKKLETENKVVLDDKKSSKTTPKKTKK
jgi:hypothetical protein